MDALERAEIAQREAWEDAFANPSQERLDELVEAVRHATLLAHTCRRTPPAADACPVHRYAPALQPDTCRNCGHPRNHDCHPGETA